ncbi:Rne/Rng family ribonuclease [Psychrobacter phenylpyruvicus]|uniref:Ribonuclease E n=1 Tax=Psychrobacter phenylpyruvicus TaxID=29432 RepID=A0A379LNV1_9GAMM|nr:Rne/Rng family ribonuclease [Psychrobacter phenylpyruvicus]SUD91547.1 Ribonuclease E [Psychrobacter phenylpyruvicus]
MKRILINATHNEEVRVALCKGNHLYDFDLENRTREQKKANIYKGHVTRVEPSLEAVFVEYGSKRQGFLPVREIASEYLSGNPREENIRKLIKEGDELIVQVEKEERGNKGAALSTYVSLAGRYLVLMPNNPKGGGISRQISGKLREDMKRMLGNLDLPKGMSVIVRTAGIGKTQEDLQHDLNHLLNIWNAIQDQNKKYASPRLVHQEAGVVTRAVRDYLRDDISEIWIDNEEAFIEAETFIKAVMPTQIDKLRKYTDFEPMFSSFNVERQIETAYQREVRLPSGGSIVIDQTEALVSIDINSAKSTKGADVAETAYHTNLEAADEIARQLRLRDMGGLIVIDFIDMNDSKHQKDVEKRLVEATKYDRARVQFGEISRFGLMEMSRQRLRPSLEESTGYICPRCHGNGMIRDLRSLSLSIMRQIEQTALKERHGEVQAEVPTDIAAFLLNEKRESLVYLEQDSGTRITILPHAHLESPNFNLHFNHHGFAPASYERVTDTQQQESSNLGYEVDWQTAEAERPEQQPTRQPRQPSSDQTKRAASKPAATEPVATPAQAPATQKQAQVEQAKPAAVAWLSNLFAPTPQAQMSATVSSADAAQAIEAIVNTGAQSRGAFGQVSTTPVAPTPESATVATEPATQTETESKDDSSTESDNDKDRRRSRSSRSRNKYDKRAKSESRRRQPEKDDKKSTQQTDKSDAQPSVPSQQSDTSAKELPKREPNSKRESRGPIERGETKQPHSKSSSSNQDQRAKQEDKNKGSDKNGARSQNERQVDPNEVNLRVTEAEITLKKPEVVHISLDDTKADQASEAKSDKSDKTDATASAKSDEKAAAKAQPKTAAEKNVEVAAKAESDPGKADQAEMQQSKAEAQQTKAEEQKPAKSEVTEKAAKTETKQADDTAAAKAEKVAEEPAKEKVETAKQKTKPVATKPAQENETESDNSSLSFDTSELFADRYVAAQKFGQASNDPRLIKASLMKQSEEVADTEQAQATPAAAITGTVGQFIHTHLAQPSMRLAKDGVITCFLAALNAHKETSGGHSKPAAKRKTAKKNSANVAQAFSFVNYGYQSLSPSYLERFAQMTSAVAAHNVEQGKTEVEPTPIGARASNDPRGQHPDYTAPAADSTTEVEVESAVIAEAKAATTKADQEPAPEAKTAVEAVQKTDSSTSKASMASLLTLNVGGFVNQVLGQEGLDIIQSGQTEAAFLKAMSQPSDLLISAAQRLTSGTPKQQVAQGLEQPATALVDEPQADEVGDESSEVLQDAKSEAQDSSATASNKTSIETYKSMIENISEQLLPQTGLLNLTSPKVPKARSRKTKEEQKKQVQADNTSDSNNES